MKTMVLCVLSFKSLTRSSTMSTTEKLLKTRAWVMRLNKFKKQTTRHTILVLMTMGGLA